jgi:hypothetical protein
MKLQNKYNLEIERSSKVSMKFLSDNAIRVERMEKPQPPNEFCPTFKGIILCTEIELCKNKDRMRALCQVIDKNINGNLPTWSAYNSLLTFVPKYNNTPRIATISFTSHQLVNTVYIAQDRTGH